MKILAIRFARLGDVILLLPALSVLKQSLPDSHLTFLTGHRCAPIAELCPAVDDVITVDRIAMRDGPWWAAMRGMARLVRDIRARKFDIAVDFHSFRETNLLTWLSGAPVRLGMKRHEAPYLGFCFNRPPVLEDKSIHVAEMFMRVAGGTALPGPSLVLPHLEKSVPPKLVLYVDAPVRERIWPPESFAQVADAAIEKFGAVVQVISGKEGADLAGRVRNASRNGKVLLIATDLTLRQLAEAIASARLLISNDTGPMHLGPAFGVPTLGLFSVGYPEHFRPTGPNDRFFRANPIGKIEVKAVIEAMEETWTRAGRDLRR